MSVKLPAWTRTGKAVEATSASEAASQAGLDWSVSLHNLHASYPIITDTGVETKILPVENRMGVIKTLPTGETSVIGVVGKKYKPLQNEEVFSALDTLIDSSDMRYSAAGEYDGGAKVWMILEVPNGITIANDPHASFILARTSHDGSSSLVIKPIILRHMCQNQINSIYKSKTKHTYTMRHTLNSELSLQDVRNIIELSYNNAHEYAALATNLLGKKVVTRQQALEYFKRVWALPSKTENTPLHLLSKGEKTARTRALQARQIAMNIYTESDTQANIRGTEFGLWQAVVEYADHHTRNSAVNTIAQRNDSIKQRALALLV
jgi:phage/plasmid-like protein (TIGR03299 family)